MYAFQQFLFFCEVEEDFKPIKVYNGVYNLGTSIRIFKRLEIGRTKCFYIIDTVNSCRYRNKNRYRYIRLKEIDIDIKKLKNSNIFDEIVFKTRLIYYRAISSKSGTSNPPPPEIF